MVWVAVFQRNLLFASSGDGLMVDVVCLLRTVSIPDDWVSVWKDTISMLFGLKSCHEIERGGCMMWNGNPGSMISHTTFYRYIDSI
jgi:hypothetical protein